VVDTVSVGAREVLASKLGAVLVNVLATLLDTVFRAAEVRATDVVVSRTTVPHTPSALVFRPFRETVLVDGTPTLSSEVLVKSSIIVTFTSESSPFTESHHSVLVGDVESLEFSNVDFAFSNDGSRSDAGGDGSVNNDGFHHLLSDGLGGDHWFNELDSLLEVDGFSDSDLLLDGDVVSDFDLLGEGLGFEGLDFLDSGNRLNDLNSLHDGDVLDDLDGLGDKSGFHNFDFLHDNSGFNDFDLLGDGDSLSVLDISEDLGGFQDFDGFEVSSSLNDVDFLQEGSGFNELLLFSEDLSLGNSDGDFFSDDFLFNDDGVFNNDFFSNNTSLSLGDGSVINEASVEGASLIVTSSSEASLFETSGTVASAETRSGEGGFQEDLTSGLVLVGQRVPSAGLATLLELVQVKKEAADVVVTGESVLVHDLDDDLALVAKGNGDGVIPVGVLATLLADLALEDAITNDESTVGVHLSEQVGVVGEVGLNGSESDGAGHCES